MPARYPDRQGGAARRRRLRSSLGVARLIPENPIRIGPPRRSSCADDTLRKVTANADALCVPTSARRRTRGGNMKKGVDWRERIYRASNGLPLRGRPGGRQTGTKPGKRSIPKAWRDLDNECLEFALNNLSDENLDDEQFVSGAAGRARFHERRGDYKIRKLSDKPTERKPTGLRQPRTHEQRVRRKANEVLEEVRRELLELKP